MKHFLFVVLVFTLPFWGFTQDKSHQKLTSIAFQTGFLVDNNNSMSFSTNLEMQKKVHAKWSYGIAYGNNRHFRYFTTDNYLTPTNATHLSLNGYYQVNLIKNALFWDVGLGVGAAHIYWNQSDRVGFTATASATLNLKITQRIFLQASPLFVLIPTNRIYLSLIETPHKSFYYAFSYFPFGIRVTI